MFLRKAYYQAWWVWVGFISLVVLLGLSNPAKAQTERVVTIDGSLTEIVFALGEGSKVVGRDVTSVYPKQVMDLPSVGYMRALSAEGILSLNPTLVIATSDAKPQKVLQQLQKAGVKVEIIDNTYSAEGVTDKIVQVAKVLNVESAGQMLVDKVSAEVQQARDYANTQLQKSGEKQAIFILNARKGNLMVAGDQTRANKLMSMVGVVNPLASSIKGYKPLTPESAIQYNPEYILTMAHSVKTAGGLDTFKKSKILQMTAAGKQDRYVVLSNDDLGFGPRLGQAMQRLADAIYLP